MLGFFCTERLNFSHLLPIISTTPMHFEKKIPLPEKNPAVIVQLATNHTIFTANYKAACK